MIEILTTALLGGYLCFFLLAVFPELLPPSPVAMWWVFRMVWRHRGRRVCVYFDRPLRFGLDRRLYGPCSMSVAGLLMLDLAHQYRDAELQLHDSQKEHAFHCSYRLPDWRFLRWRVPASQVKYQIR